MVTITPTAGEQLRAVLEQQASEESGLRVWVQSACGCGNVGYGMGIDETASGDSVYESEGIRVILDPASASLLAGARIEFVDHGLHGRGFAIQTPDDAPVAGGGGCGCGAH